MQADETKDIDPPASATSQNNAPQLSAKLRDKIEKLAKWRLDPSCIEFPEDACELHGGHATVSRALLASTSDIGSTSNEYEGAEGGKMMSDGDDLIQAIAVKKLKIENEDDWERGLGLALREAGLLVELSHNNVIKLKGFVEDLSNGRIWLIFPWEEHGNLKDFVASRDWEIPERLALIYDVTLGVDYLHTRNPPIYHGDLKSVNVLVTSKCRAVITDFGSARRLTKKHPDTQSTFIENKSQQGIEFQATFCASTNTMTLTGNEYTLRWAAPELLMDDEPSLGSDIWSLGWVWYEVMTNSIPFENFKKDSIIIKHVVKGNLPSLADHARMSLIIRLYSLMIECWSVDVTKRPTAVDCRKSVKWMPRVTPESKRTSDSEALIARSPALLLKLGSTHMGQHDYINALRFFADALAIYTEAGNSAGKASALWRLAEVHRFRGEYSKAAGFYSESLQICTDIGAQQERAPALFGLAKVHRHQNEFGKAIALYHEIVQISIDTHDRAKKAGALRGLAEVHRMQKDYTRAITLYAEASEIHTDTGNRGGNADALWGIAEVHRIQGDYSQAETHFSEALRIFIELGDRRGRADTLSALAKIHHDQNHNLDAIRLYEQAAEIFEEIGNTERLAKASSRIAHIRRQLAPEEAE